MTENFSEYEKWCMSELKELPGWTREFRSFYIALCAINGLLAVSSVVNNSLVITALIKTAALHKPSFILLFLLAVSDLGVGSTVQPLYIFKQVVIIRGTDHHMYCSSSLIYHSASILLTVLSFLTIAAISVDRHLAVHLRNRYAINVTKKRMRIVVFFTLALSTVPVFTVYLATNGIHIAGIVIVTCFPLCFIITAFNFIKVHQTLRRQRNIIHVCPVKTKPRRSSVEPGGPNRYAGSEIYRKASRSMTYVFGAVVLCYLPVMILHVGVERGVG